MTSPLPAGARARRGLLGTLRGFAAATSGIAAVEFALIYPLMMVLYMGAAEITRAVGQSRKITLLARTLGDLTARGGLSSTDADMSLIFKAATSVMAPYSPLNATMIVASVAVKDVGGNFQSSICWAKGWKANAAGGNAGATGVPSRNDPVTPTPDGYKTDKMRYIQVRVTQSYAPMIGDRVLGYVTGTGGNRVITFSETMVWPVRSTEKKTASDPYYEVLAPDGTSCTGVS